MPTIIMKKTVAGSYYEAIYIEGITEEDLGNVKTYYENKGYVEGTWEEYEQANIIIETRYGKTT
jgi:hypothetical protein